MKKTQETDMELLTGIKNDENACYHKLFLRYYEQLCQYVYSFLLDQEDTKDVVQDLLLQIWNHRKQIEINENVSSYLFKMARNMAINHIRTKNNYRSLLAKQEQTEAYYEKDLLEISEFRQALYGCINQLPKRTKEVFLLQRMQGLKQKEISEKLSISVKTIKNQIRVSLQKLKKCLEIKEI